MAQLFTVPQQVALDTGGLVISGAKLFFALSGTTTLTTVYADNALTTPLSNPVVADSSGRFAAVYLNPALPVRASCRTADATTISNGTAIYDIEYPSISAGVTATVALMTAMLKAGLTDGVLLEVLGYSTAGDGGGGTFRWSSASTATTNAGTVFAADEGGTGRWLRVYQDGVSPKWFGAKGDGATNDTAAFTAARTLTARYFLPAGTYVVDVSPDVFADAFTAAGATFIKIGATTYTVSNAFFGPWRYVAGSNVLMSVVHAVSGNTIYSIQNGASGTATYWYRGHSITTDSHWLQVSPGSEGGTTDFLAQQTATGTLYNADGTTPATATLTQTGTAITVSAASVSNILAVGTVLKSAGLANRTVTALGTGTGGTGTYTVDVSETIAGATVFTAYDPAGNRQNVTWEPALDRTSYSVATRLTGTPNFDQWMVPYGPRGTYPSTIQYPALQAVFRQGIKITPRTDGGFYAEFVPVSSTRSAILGDGTALISMEAAKLGFFNTAPVAKPTGVPVTAADIHAALVTLGLIAA